MVIPSSDRLLLTLLSERLHQKAYLLAVKLERQGSNRLKGVSIQWTYEAPGTQLSPPIVHNEKAYLIQRGPELVALELEGGQIQSGGPLVPGKRYHLRLVNRTPEIIEYCLVSGDVFDWVCP